MMTVVWAEKTKSTPPAGKEAEDTGGGVLSPAEGAEREKSLSLSFLCLFLCLCLSYVCSTKTTFAVFVRSSEKGLPDVYLHVAIL